MNSSSSSDSEASGTSTIETHQGKSNARRNAQLRHRSGPSRKPPSRKPVWTHDEEMMMARKHCQLGNRWTTIAKCVAGRSECEVKNHWNSTLRCKTSTKASRPFYIYAKMCSQDLADTPASRQHAFTTAYGTTAEVMSTAGKPRSKQPTAAASSRGGAAPPAAAAAQEDDTDMDGQDMEVDIIKVRRTPKVRLPSRRMPMSRSSSTTELRDLEHAAAATATTAMAAAATAAAAAATAATANKMAFKAPLSVPISRATLSKRRHMASSDDEVFNYAIPEGDETEDMSDQETDKKASGLKEAVRKLPAMAPPPLTSPSVLKAKLLSLSGLKPRPLSQPPSSSASPESFSMGMGMPALKPLSICMGPGNGTLPRTSTPQTGTGSTRSSTACLDLDLQLYLEGLPLTKDPAFILDLPASMPATNADKTAGSGPSGNTPATAGMLPAPSKAHPAPHMAPTSAVQAPAAPQAPLAALLPQGFPVRAQTPGLLDLDLDLPNQPNLQDFKGWLLDLQREGEEEEAEQEGHGCPMQVDGREEEEQEEADGCLLWRPAKRQCLPSGPNPRDQAARRCLLPAPVPLAMPSKEDLAALQRLSPALPDLVMLDFAITPPPTDAILSAFPPAHHGAPSSAQLMPESLLPNMQPLVPEVPGACLAPPPDIKAEALLPGQSSSLQPTGACQMPLTFQAPCYWPAAAPAAAPAWDVSATAGHAQLASLACLPASCCLPGQERLPGTRCGSGPPAGLVQRSNSCCSWEDDMDNLLCHAAAAAWLL